MDELKAVLARYEDVIDYNVVNLAKLPFKTQIELLTGAHVIISGHGAGLTNMMFCLPGVAVIEIFPFKIFMDAYQRFAAAIQLFYQPLYSNLQGTRLHWHYTDAWQDRNRT